MIIEELSPAGHPEWDAYVEAREDATLYNLSGWGAVVVHSYGITPYLLLARDGRGGRIRGGVPLFVVPRPLNHYVTNGVFGAYAPLLADDEAICAELAAAARRFTDEQRADFLHLKSLDEGPTPP